jgi:hypothetical protein
MKKYLTLTLLLALLFPLAPAPAGAMEMEHGRSHASGHEQMKHTAAPAQNTYQEVVEGVRAEFQVMSLASMNMKDPAGNTHHVMVRFFDNNTNEQITDAVGKVKVIAPDDAEQISPLTNYSGVYAANMTFAQHGKYGIICLFKAAGKKGLIKFWYNYPGS